MSLQVWLPLNGDLHNQGLNGLTVTNNGATVNNSGKIGKCYSFDGNDDKLVSSTAAISTNSFSQGSLSCWVKLNTLPTDSGTVKWMSLIQIGTLGGFANCIFGLYLEYSKYINISINGSSTGGNRYQHSLAINTWYHICTTYNENIVKIYLNGQEVMTKIATKGTLIMNNANLYVGGTSGYFTNGYLNDIRYYDHALSAKEVEEIAKGLVLHYKLDDQFCESTTNLCNNLKSGGRTVLSTNPLMITTTGENADTYWYVKTSSALVSGTVYTISLNCTGLSSGEYWKFGVGAQSGANNCGYFSIYQGYNTFTFTLPSGLNGATQLILDDMGGSSGIRGKITNFFNVQVEAKDHATGYAGVGGSRVATTIYDSSGYGNDGTIIGNLTIDSNSPRYNIATAFDGTNAIKYTNFNLGNIWSAGLWFNAASGITSGWDSLFAVNSNGGDSDLKMNLYLNTATGSIQYSANGQYIVVSAAAPNKDSWYHIFETFDGITLSCYVNGVLKTTKTITNTEFTRSNLYVSGRSSSTNGSTSANKFHGKLSDFRIYATALSADDILELYNTSMSIDNNGNIHARELVEL